MDKKTGIRRRVSGWGLLKGVHPPIVAIEEDTGPVNDRADLGRAPPGTPGSASRSGSATSGGVPKINLLASFAPTVSSEYVFSAELGVADGPLGLQGSFVRDKFTVLSVKSGMWGERTGVKIGDTIEAINGIEISSIIGSVSPSKKGSASPSKSSASGTSSVSGTVASTNSKKNGNTVLKMLQKRPVKLTFRRN